MPISSKILELGNVRRNELTSKNLYRIDSPYDLTNDIVTRSLDLVTNSTGIDLRQNPYIDLIERLVDASNSKLVRIGGQRLAVEFGRRAIQNYLGEFVIDPISKYLGVENKKFNKADLKITNYTIDSDYVGIKKILDQSIGMRDPVNPIDKTDGSSDVNYKYLGRAYKELINQNANKSIFFTYGIDGDNSFNFQQQSLSFRNSYDFDFVVTDDSLSSNISNYEIKYNRRIYGKFYEKPKDQLLKNFKQESKAIYEDSGFGYNQNDIDINSIRNQIPSLKTETLLNADIISERQTLSDQLEQFVYDSDSILQKTINENYNVKRGLLYYTSKIANESNTIAQNKKIYSDDNDEVIMYKGNGECRTFTIYDRYDNYGRLIRFNGNGNPNSVLQNSVMPKIVPYSNNWKGENFFMSMENLALTGFLKDDDCEYGVNGGRLMWFVPYDLKMYDNNSADYLSTSFLGRPELVYSYINSKRQMSLTFKLLIDTVKELNDNGQTINNYKNFLYGCGNAANNLDLTNVNKKYKSEVTKKETIINKTTKVANYDFYGGTTVYFANDEYYIDTPLVYTALGRYSEVDFRENDSYSNYATNLINFIDNHYDSNITIEIKGNTSNNWGTLYNKRLGMRRANNLMLDIVDRIYVSGNIIEIDPRTQIPIIGPSTNEDTQFNEIKTLNNVTYIYEYKSPTNKIRFEITTFGAGNETNSVIDSEDLTGAFVNDHRVIKERNAQIIKVYTSPIDVIYDGNVAETIPNGVDADEINNLEISEITGKNDDPCDPHLNLSFKEIKSDNKFPIGFEQLNVFTPIFNSQTPYDFVKRYIYLHQLIRPSKLAVNGQPDNTVFGRMPVLVLRIGDFFYTKAIVNSVNFDISDSMWDLNPEGMGAIPMTCNVSLDLTLIGGQSLNGPIDRIQTANDYNYISTSSFNTRNYSPIHNSMYRKQEENQKEQEKLNNLKK